MAKSGYSAENIEDLQSRLRGALIQPNDADYDEARMVYNSMHDKKPALIVRAANVGDVLATVDFAATHGADLALKGGAHSVPGFGTCEGGIVLDNSSMKGIRVDPEKKTVRAEAGVTWGDFNHGTNAFGLATTGGVVSTTGIVGLTLGGGMGYLTRQCGLAIDNVISADVVTADGRFLTCNKDENADLFWALRGGGGNFGVVTSLEYRLYPISDVFMGVTFFEPKPEVLHNYQERIAKGPEELGSVAAMALGLPVPFLPEKWHGKPVLAVISCWTGAHKEDTAIADLISGLGSVAGQNLWRAPYPIINTLFDELLPKGLRHYWKASFARDLGESAIKAHLEEGAKMPTVESGGFIFPINGACNRMAPEETAFGGRHCEYSVVVSGTWHEAKDDDANIQWVRDYHAALEPFSEAGGYINFMSEDDQGRAASNFGQAYERLCKVKTQYDPGNLFHINQNVPPSA